MQLFVLHVLQTKHLFVQPTNLKDHMEYSHFLCTESIFCSRRTPNFWTLVYIRKSVNTFESSYTSSSTLICSSRAVRRVMRCVRLGLVTLCCPSFVELLSCTICWASSSQRRRSSVGWSAGTMPWSGASWTDKQVIKDGSVVHLSYIGQDWRGSEKL